MKKPLIFFIALVFSFSSVHCAVFTVTNTNDSGAGSLRQAILDANQTPETDDIINITVSGTIILTTADIPDALLLPDLQEGTINGNGIRLQKGNGVEGRILQLSENCVVNDIIFDGGTAAFRGGGVGVSAQSGSTIINNCLFVNNFAGTSVNPNFEFNGRGGAIAVFNGTLTLDNCTFTNNRAKDGAAIFVQPGATLNMNLCTFSGNCLDSPSEPTASTIYNAGTLNFTNCIVANSVDALNKSNTVGVDIYDTGNTIVINENNLVETCGGAGCPVPESEEDFAFTEDPMLGPLELNGGAVPTFSLLPESPVLNADIGSVPEDPVPTQLAEELPLFNGRALLMLSLLMIGIGSLLVRKYHFL